jgi:hypothetical protein
VPTKERRLLLSCDLCRGSSKPGFLWLGGSDYVECPQCFASRTVEVVERLVVPGKTFVVGNYVKG